MSETQKKEQRLVFCIDRIIWQNEAGEKAGKKATKWKLISAEVTVDESFPEKARNGCRVGNRTIIKLTGEVDVPDYKGQKMDAYGEWEYRNNEFSFKAGYVAKHFPTKDEEMDVILFLRHCGLRISGKVADAIVAKFGYDLHEIAVAADEIAATIKGISYQTCVRLTERINQAEATAALMQELKDIGIDYSSVVKIVRRCGPKSLSVVHSEPFLLLRDIGFAACDKIHLGFGGNIIDQQRIRAAIRAGYAKYKTRNQSILAERGELVRLSMQTLNRPGVPIINQKQVDDCLEGMLRDYTFVKQGQYIYDKEDFISERDLAQKIFALSNVKVRKSKEVDTFLSSLDGWSENGIALEGQQKQAVATVAENVVSALTGGPGTGKTTTIRAIIDCYKSAFPDAPIVLMAPTGLAAKRMSDCAGREAWTCHKALGLAPADTVSGFSVEGETLDMSGLVICDETSMVGIHLAGFLMESIVYTPHSRVVFVGDIFQLPPVSQGAFFEDLIASNTVPVTYLERNFRQEAGNTIIDAAYAIKNGAANAIRYTDDFTLIRCKDEEIVSNIIECFKKGMAQYGLSQTFVLSPMHRAGELCTNKLNPILQDIANPKVDGQTVIKRGGIEYRCGDRVICTKNAENVVNGDIGTIESISLGSESGEMEVKVKFETVSVVFTKDKLDMLELAYAISVHKSQGCEFACVIIPASFSQSIMLVRNLLYTGVTRAKKKVYMVGAEGAIGKATRTVPPKVTKSLLPLRLMKRRMEAEKGNKSA